MAQASRTGVTQSLNEVTVERLHGENDGIAYLTMNRPEAKNALSRSFVSQFESCLQYLKTESWPRVVIVRSQVPGVFCAGADLKER